MMRVACHVSITGRSIACSRCGASIQLSSSALIAPCSSCGHNEPVPQEVVDELLGYEGKYAASLDDANTSLKNAQYMEDVAGQARSSVNPQKLIVGLFVFITVLGGGAQLLLMSGSPGAAPLVCLFPVVVFIAVAVVLFLVFRQKRLRAAQVSAGSVPVACPTCGAPNQLVAGAAGSACDYCGSRLVPSTTVIRGVLDAGVVAQRQAGLRVLRAERSMTLVLRKATANPYRFVLAFMLMPFIGVPIAFALSGDGTGPLIGLAGIAILLVLFAVPYFLLRHQRRQAWKEPLQNLALQFGGRHSAELVDQVKWLNAYWSDTYRDAWIFGAGTRFGIVTADVGGYPLLLDTNPEGSIDRARNLVAYPPRLNILVAAYIPLEAQSLKRLSPEARTHFDALSHAGFVLTLSTSGILAEANSDVIAGCDHKPGGLRSLAKTFQSLTGLAGHLGKPVPPLH